MSTSQAKLIPDEKIHQQSLQRSQLTAKIASLPSDVLAQSSKAAPENENNL
jgi:outer membrane murein-binding lipoprotein Lpp